MKGVHGPVLTKERRERRGKCVMYLRRAGNLPDAMRLAGKDGFYCNTSVWIGALGEVFRALTKERRKR